MVVVFWLRRACDGSHFYGDDYVCCNLRLLVILSAVHMCATIGVGARILICVWIIFPNYIVAIVASHCDCYCFGGIFFRFDYCVRFYAFKASKFRFSPALIATPRIEMFGICIDIVRSEAVGNAENILSLNPAAVKIAIASSF